MAEQQQILFHSTRHILSIFMCPLQHRRRFRSIFATDEDSRIGSKNPNVSSQKVKWVQVVKNSMAYFMIYLVFFGSFLVIWSVRS